MTPDQRIKLAFQPLKGVSIGDAFRADDDCLYLNIGYTNLFNVNSG